MMRKLHFDDYAAIATLVGVLTVIIIGMVFGI